MVRDYVPAADGPELAEAVLAELEALSPTDLVDIAAVAQGPRPRPGEHLDGAVAPRGYRLLAKVPRLPTPVVDRLVEHFETLQKLLSASVEDLQTVDGVGELRARSVREGLSRLAESTHPRAVRLTGQASSGTCRGRCNAPTGSAPVDRLSATSPWP